LCRNDLCWPLLLGGGWWDRKPAGNRHRDRERSGPPMQPPAQRRASTGHPGLPSFELGDRIAPSLLCRFQGQLNLP
jgi:hypothetical protein